eukprot:gb/GECH01014364.1/.p1 GENE.gb/GECH01014364.1/~~gb/GECH01014364.1/.p1  ORF type:complete len:476 (+),score=108.17 gb/GECH01014364.1/:1-1428(+)
MFLKNKQTAFFEKVNGNHFFHKFFSSKTLYQSTALFSLPSGETVLYAFGGVSNSEFTNKTFAYNLNRNEWRECEVISDTIPTPRGMCATASDSHGHLYIFGGRQQDKHFNDFYKMSIAGNQTDPYQIEWTQIDAEFCPESRWLATMVLFEGQLFLFGGTCGDTHLFHDVWVFDIDTGTWDLIDTHGARPDAICGHSAHVFGHKMYIIGGLEVQQNVSGDAFQEPFMPVGSPRTHHAISLDSEGRRDGPHKDTTLFYHKDVHVLDLNSKIWRQIRVKHHNPGPRFCSMTTLVGEHIILMGGDRSAVEDVGGIPSKSNILYSFDTQDGKWSVYKIKNLKESRYLIMELQNTKGMSLISSSRIKSSSPGSDHYEAKFYVFGGVVVPHFLQVTLNNVPSSETHHPAPIQVRPRKRASSMDPPASPLETPPHSPVHEFEGTTAFFHHGDPPSSKKNRKRSGSLLKKLMNGDSSEGHKKLL